MISPYCILHIIFLMLCALGMYASSIGKKPFWFMLNTVFLCVNVIMLNHYLKVLL